MIWTSHPFLHHYLTKRCAKETREATASLRRSVEQQQRLYQLLGNGVTKGWAFQGELNNCLLWGLQISRTLWPWKDGHGNQSDGMVRDAITTVSYLFAANYTPEQKWTPMVSLQKLMHERFRPKKKHMCQRSTRFPRFPKKNTATPPTPFGFVNILVFSHESSGWRPPTFNGSWMKPRNERMEFQLIGWK